MRARQASTERLDVPISSVADGVADRTASVRGAPLLVTGDNTSGSAGGNAFAYAHKKSPNRLLHMPLAPEIPNLSQGHQLFIAGRSMRDVEPSVTLKVKDPDGRVIANADDV